MMKYQELFQQITYLTFIVILLASCEGNAPKSISEAPAATAAPEQAATPTSEPATPTPGPPTATPTPEPAIPTPKPPTATPTPEPSVENAEEVVIDPLAVGNPERGREIFETGGGVVSENLSCSECHSLDGTLMKHASAGPSFQGIAERAGNLVPELSTIEYLRQSIEDPNAYIVDGYRDNRMPKAYSIFMSEEEINDVIAFLLTQ